MEHLSQMTRLRRVPPALVGWIIVAVGLALRLAVAWSDVATLVEKALPDDAFYYFIIVENALAGRGITFDGLAPNNGFHPLWALLLAPILALAPSRDVALHVALTVASLFEAGTIYLAYRAGRRFLQDELAGLLAAVFYALNPRLILEGVNGLETALSTLVFAGTAVWYWNMRARAGDLPGLKRWIGLGLLTGLLLWSRTDHIFFIVAIGLDALLHWRRRVLPSLVVAGAVCAGLLSPWLAWNSFTFGSPLQSSGVAVPYVVRTYLFQLSQAAGLLRVIGPALYLLSVLLSTLVDYLWLPLGAILAYLVWRIVNGGRPNRASLPPAWSIPMIGSGALLLFHALVRYFLRGWYVIPFAFSISVLAGALLAHLGRSRAGRPLAQLVFRVGSSLVIVVTFIGSGLPLWNNGAYPWQSAMRQAGQWAAQELPAGTVIGSFNAGIIRWFSGQPVLNLDGVVSGPAFEAIRRRGLLGFARQHGVQVILDWQSSVERTYAPFFESDYRQALEPITQFAAPAGAPAVWDLLVAYRLKPSS